MDRFIFVYEMYPPQFHWRTTPHVVLYIANTENREYICLESSARIMMPSNKLHDLLHLVETSPQAVLARYTTWQVSGSCNRVAMSRAVDPAVVCRRP